MISSRRRHLNSCASSWIYFGRTESCSDGHSANTYILSEGSTKSFRSSMFRLFRDSETLSSVTSSASSASILSGSFVWPCRIFSASFLSPRGNFYKHSEGTSINISRRKLGSLTLCTRKICSRACSEYEGLSRLLWRNCSVASGFFSSTCSTTGVGSTCFYFRTFSIVLKSIDSSWLEGCLLSLSSLALLLPLLLLPLFSLSDWLSCFSLAFS